jgi:VWFA-related protein
VDAFVTRNGAPVTGLQARDFDLRDEGVSQELELVAVEDVRLTVLFVFDTSGSLEGARLAALRASGDAFLGSLRPEDEVGLLSFSHQIKLVQAPSTDRAKVRSALRELRVEGGTALWDALHSALTLLPRNRRALVVVFSDGEDNASFLGDREVPSEAERANALVEAVGFVAATPVRPVSLFPRSFVIREVLGFAVEPGMALRATAESTGGRLWTADDPARLTAAFAGISAAMNTRYVLRFEPDVRARAGWHRLDVRLRGGKGEVRARRGYFRMSAIAAPDAPPGASLGP